MISEEKIKIMTRVARFEKHEKEALKAGRYYAVDYILIGLIRSFAAYTVLFMLVTLMGLFYYSEELVARGSLEELIVLAQRIGMSYLVLLVPLAVIVWLVNSVRYVRFIKIIKHYRRTLKELEAYYRNEDKANRGGTTV